MGLGAVQQVLKDYQNAVVSYGYCSFLKLDNITLGYSFPRLFGYDINGRIYATVQNVWTWTKYSGIDPEVNGGYDGDIYPRALTSILGLTLNF